MKNKSIIRRIFAVMCIFALLAALPVGVSAQEDSGLSFTPIDDGDFLGVRGSTIVTADGEPVLLRGTNVGGWLIQECWMCPVSGVDKHWGNLDTIHKMEELGFTAEQIQTLFDSYQDNYITEYDLDIIASVGSNVVRVPFWYRNFMLDAEGTWINENFDENPGFKRLDWIIEECGKRGMYVILDMHGCPGGQSTDHCCGTIGKNELYSNEVYQQTMEDLWVAIADRYKDSPVVAAYDIMNEPQNNTIPAENSANFYDPWKPASWEATNAIYERMVAAIRKIDTEHIISVEGIWRVTNLPDPDKYGWYNMLYQVHLYDGTEDFMTHAAATREFGKKHDVAVYVGEFSNMECLEFCNENSLNWTTWSYKGGKGANGTWFWVSGTTPVVTWSDDYDTMLEKWGEVLRTDGGKYSFNMQVMTTVKQAMQFEYVPAAEDIEVDPEWFNSVSFGGEFYAGKDCVVGTALNGLGTCVKLTVSGEGDPGQERSCVIFAPQEGVPFDASDYGYLIFSVKDTQGSNSMRLTVKDADGKVWSGWVDELPVNNEWTKTVVPLSVIQGVDLSKIAEIRIGEWNPGVYYFDSVYFASYDTSEAPSDNTLVIVIGAAAGVVIAVAAVVIAVCAKKKAAKKKEA